MIFSFNIAASMTRELSEQELDELVKDLWSFKTVARMNGKLLNKPNYIFNVYDETEFNEVTEKFSGDVRVYFECNTCNVSDTIEQIATIFSKHECAVFQIVKKFKVSP